MSAVKAVHLSEIPPYAEPEPGASAWLPVRHHLGINAFGVNAWAAAKTGDRVIESHVEETEGGSPHEELYFVVSGHATFSVDGEDVDAPAGTFVFVANPMASRGAVAREDGTTVLAVGAARGIAYEISPWERTHWET